ncbi:MAG: hypothetical protein WD081_03865 [Gammaproteobacteria bacterium]
MATKKNPNRLVVIVGTRNEERVTVLTVQWLVDEMIGPDWEKIPVKRLIGLLEPGVGSPDLPIVVVTGERMDVNHPLDPELPFDPEQVVVLHAAPAPHRDWARGKATARRAKRSGEQRKLPLDDEEKADG